jgi:uncharacterized membrane protein YbhN (UPF0104 family)
VEKVIVTIGATIGGSVGWWMGSGVGFMTAFFISIVGTGVGMYYSRRLAKNILP